MEPVFMHPLHLCFSDASLEGGFRAKFTHSCVFTDVLWSRIAILTLVAVVMIRYRAHLAHMALAEAMTTLLIASAWSAPAIVYQCLGCKTYEAHRTGLAMATRYAAVCYDLGYQFRELGALDLLLEMVVMPYLFPLQFRDFVLPTALQACTLCWRFTKQQGWCDMAGHSSDAGMVSQLDLLHKVGLTLDALQGQAFLPTHVNLSKVQYCQCIATYATLVGSFLVPAAVCYVTEYRSRRVFSRDHSAQLDCHAAALTCEILARSLLLGCIFLWGVTTVVCQCGL